jgi:hypothetical protein
MTIVFKEDKPEHPPISLLISCIFSQIFVTGNFIFRLSALFRLHGSIAAYNLALPESAYMHTTTAITAAHAALASYAALTGCCIVHVRMLCWQSRKHPEALLLGKKKLSMYHYIIPIETHWSHILLYEV